MPGSDQTRERRFDSIFTEHLKMITEYCRWRSRTAADADDAVSEVFLTLWRRLDDVDDGEAARMWLYATARRITANHLRAGRRRAGLQERLQALPVAPAFEEAHDADDTASELVHAALAQVRSLDREVLLLAEWEQLTAAEIAVVMGCSPATARSRLYRARKRFRTVFERGVPVASSIDRPEPIDDASTPGGLLKRANAPTVERLVSERSCS